MINHIDVSQALRRSVCHLYSDLVTRPTGAAVRREIEQQLEVAGNRTLTIIDFSHVGLLDFSCADEVVAKLLLQYCTETAPREGYFVLRGVGEVHLDAIEAVLERHGLCLVIQTLDGSVRPVGELVESQRRAWEALERLGGPTPERLAEELGLNAAETEALVTALCSRRLAMTLDDGAVVAVGSAALARARREVQ
ncbi:MAG TPA: hypothetical protein VFX39_10600 [Gemmatimonadaceae bacterium]|nr:hypothetical protein [Gemmatimonadaceae bacterium]